MSTQSGTTREKAPIFLISTGRTGTKFFGSFFARHAAGVSSHHITPGTRRQNVLNNMAACGVVPQFVPDAWLAWNTLPRIRAEPLRWVECNLYYFNSLSALRTAFPAAQFVLVVRHPRQFCESHIRWERQRLLSRIANQLVPFWGPVGYHEQLLGLLGHYPQRVRYYAKVWTRRNEVILRQLDADERAITLRFEDVFNGEPGAERLAALFSALAIETTMPIDAGVLARRANETRRDGEPAWDARCDALIGRYCAPLMRRFGYELDVYPSRRGIG